MLALVWGPRLRRADGKDRLAVARAVLPGFGRVALPAFGVAVLAGALNAVIELGRLPALWETTYGVVLLVKVGLVGLVAALAYWHARRLWPRMAGGNPHASARVEQRHWRVLRAELPVAVLILAAAGLLVAFPLPPRQSDAASDARGATPPCDPCPLPRPAPQELAVAEQAGSDVVAAHLRREGAGLAGTVRILDSRGRPTGDRAVVEGARQSGCGRGCLRFSLPGGPAALRVAVVQGGRGFEAVLPARWRPDEAADARALLARAQATMRALRSVIQEESVSSGPGTGARTRYRLRAPDRLELRTAGGVERITVGARQFVRGPGTPWRQSPTAGGRPFRTASWFRWTAFAASVQLLQPAGDGTAELALADPATPVWIRLRVDVKSGRVLSERLIARARFISTRFSGFNEPVDIAAPRLGTGG
jgi:hypothetical protein